MPGRSHRCQRQLQSQLRSCRQKRTTRSLKHEGGTCWVARKVSRAHRHRVGTNFGGTVGLSTGGHRSAALAPSHQSTPKFQFQSCIIDHDNVEIISPRKTLSCAGLRGHGATRVGRNSTSAAAIGLSRGSAVPGTRIILIARSFPQYNTARVLIPGHGQPTTVCGRMHVMAPDTDYIAQRRYGSYAYNLRAQAPPRCYSDSFNSCFWILRRK